MPFTKFQAKCVRADQLRAGLKLISKKLTLFSRKAIHLAGNISREFDQAILRKTHSIMLAEADIPNWVMIPAIVLAVIIGAAIRNWAYRGRWRR